MSETIDTQDGPVSAETMVVRATFNEEGFATGFYPEDIWPKGWPADAVEITVEQWRDLLTNPGMRRWDGEKVVAYEPPAPEPGPIILPAAVFFDRTTEDEAEAIDEAMTAQPVKFRRAWAAATVFRSDNDLWPVLQAAIVELYGEARAGELLATPTAEMMRAVAQ